MAKVNLMTQAEYARHRGCSKVAVGKAVKAGRISLVNGQIDPDVADIQWQRNTRARISHGQGTRSTATAPAPGVGVGESGPALFPDTPDDAASGDGSGASSDGYTASRNRREAADAEMAELKLAEAQNSLIRVDAVKSALGSVFSTTRDALLQIPARLSPLLAAESDPASVQKMLYTELHQALQHLAGASARLGQTESVAE
jgi:hypothetical protein